MKLHRSYLRGKADDKIIQKKKNGMERGETREWPRRKAVQALGGKIHREGLEIDRRLESMPRSVIQGGMN